MHPIHKTRTHWNNNNLFTPIMTAAERRELREDNERQMADFLADGGEIKSIPMGKTGNTRKAFSQKYNELKQVSARRKSHKASKQGDY